MITQYGPVVIDEILKNQVKTQTDGQYVLDYSSLKISVLSKQVEISNLKLTKKSETQTTLSNEDVYHISVPKIEIGLASIISIYYGKELKITGIRVYDPSIKVTKLDASGSKSTLSWESGSIYKSISNYLSSFSIDQLDIKNASVQYQNKSKLPPLNILINQIDFSISNFLIDSTASDSVNFLYTDNIELIISSQTFPLADSIHNISFESFHISTKTGNILFKNLELKPKSELNTDLLPDFMDISIPALNFRGLDFSKAYQLNKLELDSVRILNPKILITRKTKSAKGGKTNLLQLSTAIFDELSIGKLYLDNAYIDILNIERNKQNRYRSTDIDIVLHKVNIDTTVSKTHEWLDVFQDISLNARTFDTYIMDSTHYVSADQLSYSSISDDLSITNLKINPIGKPVWSKPRIFVNTDLIEGHSIASIEDFIQGNILAEKIAITSPSINIRLPKNGNHGQKSDIKDLFFKNLRLDTLDLKNAHLTLKKGDIKSEVGNLSISLNKLSLTEDSFTKIHLNTICPTSDFTWDNLSFISDKLNLSLNQSHLKNWKNFSSKDVSVLPSNTKKPYTFESIKITEFDFDHFINNQLLAFDTLIINKPNIELFPSKTNDGKIANLTQWAHHTNFKEVKIQNGMLVKHGEKRIQVKLTNFDAELSKFHYDSIVHEYYTLIGYRSDSIYLHLEKIDHELTGSNVSISIKDSTLDVKHLKIKPRSGKSRNQYTVSSYELKLREIDFHHLINKKQLHFREGYLISPDIKTISHISKKQSKELSQGALKFGFLSISNGKVHSEILRNDSTMVVDIKRTNLLINNFHLGNPSSIFGAQNYLADIHEFGLSPFGKTETINIKKAFVNTKEGRILANEISFSPNDQVSLSIPKATIDGFKPLIWAKDRSIQLDSLIIDYPKVAIDLNKQVAPKTDSTTSFPPFKTKYFAIRNGAAFVLKDSLNFGKGLKFNEIMLSIDSLNINDQQLSSAELLTHLPRTKLSLKDFEILTPDSLYNLKLVHLSYEGKKNELTLINTTLNPLFNRKDFQSQIFYQKDWFDISIAKIVLAGVDAPIDPKRENLGYERNIHCRLEN